VSRYATVIDTSLSRADFFQSANADDLEARVNARLAGFSLVPTVRLAALNLSGAGDGHSFVVEILSVLDPGALEDVAVIVNPNTPSATPGSILRVICYVASDVPNLNQQRATQINQFLASTGTLFDKILDEQMAGGAKGLPFMGMILGVFSPPEPP
jgi:hypothetical protein